MVAASAPSPEFLEFNIRVENVYDRDGGYEVHTVYNGTGVEVRECSNRRDAVRARVERARI